MREKQAYWIAGPDGWRDTLAKALTILVFLAVACGIFFGAMMWAQSTARAIRVEVAN